MSRPAQRYTHLLQLSSSKDCVVEHDARWMALYERSTKCPDCAWPGREWMESPTRVDCDVAVVPRGSIAHAGAFPDLVSVALWEVLEP